MNTSLYALTHSERCWLIYSVAFLLSSAFYGSLAGRVVSAMSRPDISMILRDCPALLLISLSAGFFFTTVGHYAIRQSLIIAQKESVS